MATEKHDARLADIKRWFTSLPRGVAEMQVEASTEDLPVTQVTIRPTRNREAADITIRIYQDGSLELWAGQSFSVDDIYWDDGPLPVTDICQAIVSGGLTEVARLWNGRGVGASSWLHLPGQPKPLYDNRTYQMRGELARLLFGRFVGRSERRTFRYPPYYEAEPHATQEPAGRSDA